MYCHGGRGRGDRLRIQKAAERNPQLRSTRAAPSVKPNNPRLTRTSKPPQGGGGGTLPEKETVPRWPALTSMGIGAAARTWLRERRSGRGVASRTEPSGVSDGVATVREGCIQGV